MVYSFSGLPNELKWDGFYKGTLVPPGIYIYTAKMLLENGTTLQSKGDINVMR
jgi:hypothetical protein